jgi:hypothetical protein
MAFDCTECSFRSAQTSFYSDHWQYCPCCGSPIEDEAIDTKHDGDIETLAEESEYWIKPENEGPIGDPWDVIAVSPLDTGDGITTELRRSLEACGYEFLSAQRNDRGAIRARFRRLGSTTVGLSPSPEAGAVTMTELDEDDDQMDPDDG